MCYGNKFFLDRIIKMFWATVTQVFALTESNPLNRILVLLEIFTAFSKYFEELNSEYKTLK